MISPTTRVKSSRVAGTIRFHRAPPPDANRNFGSKVNAFTAGYARLAGLEYDFVGNLDTDISLPADYFERLLAALMHKSYLGVVGRIILENINGRYAPQNISLDNVARAV